MSSEKLSGIIGRQIFSNLESQGLVEELDFKALAASLEAAAAGEANPFSQEDEQEVFTTLQAKMQAKAAEKNKFAAEAGVKFLEENGKKDGITTTASGLQYRVVESGEGNSPSESCTVETHYEGRLINGEVFDSSYQRGQTVSFPVNGVIKGWQEALQLMKPGDKWELFIPYELAYGSTGSPPKIGPCETLIFDIELIAVK
jgi:FKBP-type peptidyl-prolyl cis-trans isomerase FklB